jgi:tetratricopeptide (TPR) repeat protein/transglutaminase-like putative cysteine protease
MSSRSCFSAVLLCAILTFAAPLASAETPDKSKTDFADEPYVFELLRNVVRYENDGTGTRETTARIRVQNEAAVQALGQMIFGYSSANEKLAIGYLRVRRSDGTTVEASPDNSQDLPAPVARQAPMYSDYREKHIPVPGLRPGEILEYRIVTTVENALFPGQFWLGYEFEKNVIVLDEQLEVSVPKGRGVKLKTQPGHDAKVTTEGDRRVYRWAGSHTEREADDTKDAHKKVHKPAELPDIEITTVADWNEVGRWYAGLERDRIVATPEVRAKAAELTKTAKTDQEKMQILYDYVAQDFRYISLSFGVGRVQPHAAGEILAHQYGDCKDKHTLLAAMLGSVGIPAYAALINAQRDTDGDIPSPMQFNHMITAVPQGKDYIWLDTTTEIAPFRLLAPSIRGKKALVVAPDGSATLVETPKQPPVENSQAVEIEGKVTELGKLQAHVRVVARGDAELAFRSMFRRASANQWKQIGEALHLSYGLPGEVANVSSSDPSKTREPFRVEYDVTASDYLDWSMHKSQPSLYLPVLWLRDAEEGKDKIELDGPAKLDVRLKLEVPSSYLARAGVPISMKRDYAEYRSDYKVENNTITAERALNIKSFDIPATRASDYAAFRRTVRADGEQKLMVESRVAGTPEIPKTAKAEDLADAGDAALKSQNFQAAAELYKRVTELDAKHKTAWLQLGRAYMALNHYDEAVAAFQKQVDIDPYDETVYSNLGYTYWRQQKYDKATEAFHKQLEVNPLSDYAHATLGTMYVEMKKYDEAVPELEKAASIKPDNPGYQVALGQAYLNVNQSDKALAAFDSAVESYPSPVIWNNVAYELSEHKVKLDRAQQYAESAITATQALLRNATLDHLRPEELTQVLSLAAYWDTLGWVHFQKGDLADAEKYIRASWLLDQHSDVGDHLGQIYEKRGDKEKAASAYAMAIAAIRPKDDTRTHLAALVGAKNVDDTVSRFRPQLAEQRTIKLPPLSTKEKGDADFFVLLAPGPKVEDVRFIRGSQKLKAYSPQLASVEYQVEFPDSAPTKLVRRGVLSCDPSQCLFVLMLPEDVHSVN